MAGCDCDEMKGPPPALSSESVINHRRGGSGGGTSLQQSGLISIFFGKYSIVYQLTDYFQCVYLLKKPTYFKAQILLTNDVQLGGKFVQINLSLINCSSETKYPSNNDVKSRQMKIQFVPILFQGVYFFNNRAKNNNILAAVILL